MGKKIFAEISKKYFGVGPVLVQGGPDLVQGGPLLVQGGPLLVQPRVSSTVQDSIKDLKDTMNLERVTEV